MSVYLNLVFHNVVKSESGVDSRYTVSIGYYNKIKEKVLGLLNSQNGKFDSLRFYFDDNFVSFYNFIFPNIKKTENIEHVIAVPTEFIGKMGYMSSTQLKELNQNNLKISPHGISHAALCIYSDSKLLPTSKGGKYSNSPYGKGKSLRKEEVAYQLIESKKVLKNIGVKNIDEFVLPYGLYNKQILEINESTAGYNFIATCDEYLDIGESLRPRFLIVSDRTIEKTCGEICELETMDHR